MDRELLHKIVLWKLDRYPEINSNTIKQIESLKTKNLSKDKDVECAKHLIMDVSGFRLPMISTILRFRNPKVFQIIDQRAYRAVYGKKYRESSNHAKAADLYFDYLKKIRALALEKRVNFEDMDRILYQFDHEENNKL